MNPFICQNVLQFRPWTHPSDRTYYSFIHEPTHLSEIITLSSTNPSICQNLLHCRPWTYPSVRTYYIVVLETYPSVRTYHSFGHEPIHLSELITVSAMNPSICQNILQLRPRTHPSVKRYYNFGHEPIHLLNVDNKSKCIKELLCARFRMSEWLLPSSNSAICQLYYGEKKLIFNKMMMKSAFYYTNTLS
jgi:hypothetical protein